tara:strand:- start:553 stop:1011 length:459 start_codon:yes stop_codon:yes gene_type:complete
VLQQATSVATLEIADLEFDGIKFTGTQSWSILRWPPVTHQSSFRRRLGTVQEYSSVGNLMFLPANIHFNTRPSAPSRFQRNMLCHFDALLDAQVSEHLSDWTKERLAICPNIRCDRIDFTLHRIKRELIDPGFASVRLLEGLLLSLAQSHHD